MLSFNYYLIKASSLKSEKRIYLYVRDKNKTLTIPTNLKIPVEAWNAHKQIVKPSHPLSLVYNDYLQNFRQKVQTVAFEVFNRNPGANFDDVAIAIKAFFNRQTADLFEALDKFIELRSSELSLSMIKKFKTLKQHLEAFREQGHNVSFASINSLMLSEFATFLIDTKNLTNNTLNKYIELLLTFLRWCEKNNLATLREIEKPKIKGFSDFIIALNLSELKKILSLDLSARPTLEKIRDLFIFACLTGARFSDVSNLKPADVKGDTWLLITKKTLDKIPIKLPALALSILHKYNYELPKFPNQTVNDALKKICEMAGINEPVTSFKLQGTKRIEKIAPKYELVSFHTARKSYITNLRALGVDIETIMSQSGHKKLEVFKRYSTTDNDRITAAIGKLNDVFCN